MQHFVIWKSNEIVTGLNEDLFLSMNLDSHPSDAIESPDLLPLWYTHNNVSQCLPSNALLCISSIQHYFDNFIIIFQDCTLSFPVNLWCDKSESSILNTHSLEFHQHQTVPYGSLNLFCSTSWYAFTLRNHPLYNFLYIFKSIIPPLT